MSLTIDGSILSSSSSASAPAFSPANAETLVWRRACRLDELDPSWGEALLVGRRQVALFLLGTDAVGAPELYAVCNRDPLSGSPVMSRGITGSRGDRPTVASPLLKQVYDLATGECFADASLFLRPFRTRVVDGVVEVEVPE